MDGNLKNVLMEMQWSDFFSPNIDTLAQGVCQYQCPI